MNIVLGIIIILATVYFLVKQYDTRMVLIAAGLLMAGIALEPLAVLDGFAKRMTTASLIQAICSVMGFAFVMKVTKCDQHLIHLVAKGLSKFRFFLIPGATLATFSINMALPSAAGCAAAVGAIFYSPAHLCRCSSRRCCNGSFRRNLRQHDESGTVS